MSKSAVESTLRLMDETVARAMNQYTLSGMAVGVVQKGKLIFAKGYGVADASTGKPVTPDTIFRIASISKTFTAIAVMQLWEQGKIQLDDPVNKYLKTYQVLHPDPNAPPVTIRHMLTHTSGIGENPTTAGLLRDLIIKQPDIKLRPGDPIPPLGEYYHGRLSPDVYPDVKWAYANHAFGTLGQLIEDVSGEPFAEYMCRHVFEPLGMMKTDFRYSEKFVEELAQGYVYKKDHLKSAEFLLFPDFAAGSVLTSVNEMALYLAALMNGGSNEHGTVIKPETLEAMMSPQYRQDPHLAAMGYGFHLEYLDGHRAAWHGGSLEGFNTALWVAPDDDLGVLVFANTNTRAIYHFAEGILRDLLGLPRLSERLPVPGVLESPHLWPEMVGSYGPPRGFNSNARAWLNYGSDLKIYVKDHHLMLKSFTGLYQKGIVLYPVDAHDPLAFENVTDGKVLQLVFQRNQHGVIDRISFTSLTFFTFYKQPVYQSVHFKVFAGIGALLGTLLAALILGRKKPNILGAGTCCRK
ncbi:MAG: beta-lactamase family protein [Chloroflexi bacterium]|nr:beta-lactamase family protein [Chloroflexota bacterium]